MQSVKQDPCYFLLQEKTDRRHRYLWIACQAAQQIIYLRYTRHMMGIPLDGCSWTFGDN
jgi:hypothetical protein